MVEHNIFVFWTGFRRDLVQKNQHAFALTFIIQKWKDRDRGKTETRERVMSTFDFVRFFVLLSLSLILMGGQSPTHAQQDIIAACANAANAEARITCLENALLGNTEAIDTAPPATNRDTAPTQSAEPSISESTISESNIAPTPVAPPAAPEPVVAATPAPEPEAKSDELGSEQVAPKRKVEETIERRVFSVASIEIAHPNKIRFFLENGQVWQQLQGDEQRLRLSKNSLSTVEIWQSKFGGYKLRIPDRRRTLRVRRIR